ncbi:PREDICTED: inactive polyglycylase TTLL10 [Galeopterus variegatus]|uniref:Inactive polyglycylase TTLL10 n=1 Tax=Galeopterus variegatus TaxID=482537 RepID=A0ABM0R701_GALVR|nr:PREDICTED: inactive polyglycylase TTLL10 [Galeopterus variegatus]
MTVACSRSQFIHCQRPPTQTQAGSKRGKRPRIQRRRARAPGWAHERLMGSGREEGLLHQLSPLDQDADRLDDADPARSPAALLEELLLRGEKRPHSTVPGTGQGPFYYIGGTNGASIISSYCESKGWQRTWDSRQGDYTLKWCEVKGRDSYCSFREVMLAQHRPPSPLPHLSTRIPRTAAPELLLYSCAPIHPPTKQAAAVSTHPRVAHDAIFPSMCPAVHSQHTCFQQQLRHPYIQNPLLLDGKKFDVRSYLLIACTMPYMVFFGHGYARLTLSLYDPHSSDLSIHLTNQFMQKKSSLYVLLKEDTVWSMDHLNRYINDNFRKTKGLPRDWVFTTFTKRMQQIMAHCFLAVKSKLQCKLGYFDLIGCDFLIDENFKVWLLEMNSNPALHTNCAVLKEVIPGVVSETLDLALETFQKSLRSQKMLPLLSQRRFVLLHNGEEDPGPRPGALRGLPHPPPPRARRPATPRDPGGAHGPGTAEEEREERKDASRSSS